MCRITNFIGGFETLVQRAAAPNTVSGVQPEAVFLPRCSEKYLKRSSETIIEVRPPRFTAGGLLYLLFWWQEESRTRLIPASTSGGRAAANTPTDSSVGGFLCRITNFIGEFETLVQRAAAPNTVSGVQPGADFSSSLSAENIKAMPHKASSAVLPFICF